MGGRCIEYQRQKKCVCAADPADRSGKYKCGHDRLVVGIFTAMTLGLLVFFKYMDFLADSVNRILGTHVPMVQIALPVGISFYTFQIISYYVDVYRGEVAAEHNFVDFAVPRQAVQGNLRSKPFYRDHRRTLPHLPRFFPM